MGKLKIITFTIALMLLLATTINFITGKAVNNFTQPDFIQYPDLILRTKDIEVLDFTSPAKSTYYYNIIGTEIDFTLENGNRKFVLEVLDVANDKEGKEYAIVEIISSNLNPAYINLYENEEVEVDLFDEKIKLNAESIIDEDNIEYLTIKGVEEFSQQITPQEIPSPEPPRQEQIQQPAQPTPRPEIPKIIKPDYTIPTIFTVILNIILLVSLIMLIHRRMR